MVTKCPVCGSIHIFLYRGGVFGKYECTNCEYVGALIIEEVKKNERIKKRKDT